MVVFSLDPVKPDRETLKGSQTPWHCQWKYTRHTIPPHRPWTTGIHGCESVRACVRAHGAGVEPAMFRLEIDGTNHCTIPPSTVSDVFLLLLYLWVVTNSQMCLRGGKKRKKKKGGIVAGQKQPLGAVWCKTRLFNSGGQFDPDRWCNSSTSTMLAHSRAIIAYDNGRSKIRGVRGGGGGGRGITQGLVII